ncbi:DUF6660 family protein [Hufsiella arboris]|uniref:DUF6660 family protein n=1 Tax=Hufsiella arboris TaxID=2695275 RepID=UPI0034E2BA03
MKILCCLLTFYVLLLAVKPCCINDSCGDNSAKKELQKGNDCNVCSPFFSCGTCNGFVINPSQEKGASLSASVPRKSYPVYLTPFFQKVTLKIWQPPKLV